MNKKHWDKQAKEKGVDSTATFKDIYLHKREVREIIKQVQQNSPKNILDIGCGNGYTTHKLSIMFPEIDITGLDLSEEMIKQAKKRNNKVLYLQDNILDLCREYLEYDLIIMTRVLINLGNRKNQLKALLNTHNLLGAEGKLILMESTEEGYIELNKLRKQYGLSQLEPHPLNTYIDDKLINKIKKKYYLLGVNNYSDTYYYGSRIIYPLCVGENNVRYDHQINEVYSKAEHNVLEECGRERMYIFIK